MSAVSLTKKALATVAGALGIIGLVNQPGGMLTGMAIGAILVTCGWPWFVEVAIATNEKSEAARAAQQAKMAAAKAAASSKLAQAIPTATPPVRAPLSPVAAERQEPVMDPVVTPVAEKRVRKVSKPIARDPLVWPELETTAPVRGSGFAMPPD